MCELKKYHKTSNTQIDKCMRFLIKGIKLMSKKEFKIVACCCGHGKYPMTIVVKDENGVYCDIVSGEIINRTRNFYKKDKQGYYYIPETLKEQEDKKTKEASKNGRKKFEGN